ncbi:MAG: YncE family protein, partial [Gelidibacter sp.]
TGVRIKQIDIDNPRYLTFFKGKAYLSSYLGSVGNANAPNGIVAEIDTTTFKITRRVEVGRQPEELVAYNDKIYVANSGGYSAPDYESTISVVDVNSFTETKRIEVAVNLHRIKIDSEGDLYVTSRGDYYDIPSMLFVVDTKTEAVKKSFDIGVSNFTIHKDIAYMYSSEFSYITGDYEISYLMLDTKTEMLLDQSFISEKNKDLIKMPYGIAVNPETDEVLITDAKDYVTPGNLYCFTPDGGFKWSVETGDIPAHITFKYE